MKHWRAIPFGLLLPPRWLGKLLACQIYISLVAHLTVVPQSQSGQPSQTIFASLNFTFFPDSPKFKSYKKTFFSSQNLHQIGLVRLRSFFCPIRCDWILWRNVLKKWAHFPLCLDVYMSSNSPSLPNFQNFIHVSLLPLTVWSCLHHFQDW